jgi:hypothetical protein
MNWFKRLFAARFPRRSASAGSAFSADIVDCYKTGGGQLFLKLRISAEAFARITINMHGKQVRVELPNSVICRKTEEHPCPPL